MENISRVRGIDFSRIVFVCLLLIIISFQALIPSTLQDNVASAAQITSRSITIGSAQTSASTTYTFGFVPATTAAIQSILFQACNAATGTCNAPSGLSFSGAGGGTVSGWTNNTNFAVDNTGANNCTPAANELCANRTQAASETGTGIRTVAFTTVTNPNGTSCATTNCTFFIRITTYSVTNYTTAGIVDTGTVASSTTSLITVSAQVSEQLTFCIGSTTIDNATTAAGTCSAISGNSLSLGNLSSSNVNVSPVGSGSGGDSKNAIAELNTNAANGVNVYYDAVAQSGTNHTRTLRVSGATCNPVTNVPTDQCLNAIGTTHLQETAGTEAFGMTIAGVNCGDVLGSYYSCSFASSTNKLIPNASYNCAGSSTYPSSENGLLGSTICFYAWDETGTAQLIANSSSVVGNEALIIKFATTLNLVSPSGIYTAQADYVATPIF